MRISIGNLYQEVLDPARLWLSSTRVKYSGVKGDAVKRLTLDLRRGTGNLDTTTLAARFTGIPAAANSAFYTNLFFPLGLDLTRSSGAAFTGEHARRIFGAGTKYSDASVRR